MMGIIRTTKSVRLLLEEFEQAERAISVVELIEKLCQKMNKTTVYRILERLESDSVLHSFMDKDGLKRYAKCGKIAVGRYLEAHPHFQCRECGKVECLPIEVNIPEISNYEIDSVKFLLVGHCDKCIA